MFIISVRISISVRFQLLPDMFYCDVVPEFAAEHSKVWIRTLDKTHSGATSTSGGMIAIVIHNIGVRQMTVSGSNPLKTICRPNFPTT